MKTRELVLAEVTVTPGLPRRTRDGAEVLGAGS